MSGIALRAWSPSTFALLIPSQAPSMMCNSKKLGLSWNTDSLSCQALLYLVSCLLLSFLTGLWLMRGLITTQRALFIFHLADAFLADVVLADGGMVFANASLPFRRSLLDCFPFLADGMMVFADAPLPPRGGYRGNQAYHERLLPCSREVQGANSFPFGEPLGQELPNRPLCSGRRRRCILSEGPPVCGKIEGITKQLKVWGEHAQGYVLHLHCFRQPQNLFTANALGAIWLALVYYSVSGQVLTHALLTRQLSYAQSDLLAKSCSVFLHATDCTCQHARDCWLLILSARTTGHDLDGSFLQHM